MWLADAFNDFRIAYAWFMRGRLRRQRVAEWREPKRSADWKRKPYHVFMPSLAASERAAHVQRQVAMQNAAMAQSLYRNGLAQYQPPPTQSNPYQNAAYDLNSQAAASGRLNSAYHQASLAGLLALQQGKIPG